MILIQSEISELYMSDAFPSKYEKRRLSTALLVFLMFPCYVNRLKKLPNMLAFFVMGYFYLQLRYRDSWVP